MLRVEVLIDEPHWRERRFRAMGAPTHLIVGGAEDPLVDWAVAEVERLEQCWSRFRADSELSLLTERAGEWSPVSPDLLGALVRARRLWEVTAGAFDPTVLRSLEVLGYDQTFTAIKAETARPVQPIPAPGFDAVEIDDVGHAVRVPTGVRLDLGGLGKGLAADLVAEGLLLRGASSALLSLGGDIRAAGEVPDDGWAIPIESPFEEDSVWTHVVLRDEAIVTSTSLLRRWRRGGEELHHIIDPISGSPTDAGVAAVVARGPEAWWSEGLAKAVMVLGETASATLLEGTGVQATIFRSDGSTVPVHGRGALCSGS